MSGRRKKLLEKDATPKKNALEMPWNFLAKKETSS